jgi:hypothetical protein
MRDNLSNVPVRFIRASIGFSAVKCLQVPGCQQQRFSGIFVRDTLIRPLRMIVHGFQDCGQTPGYPGRIIPKSIKVVKQWHGFSPFVI